jgi:hypothetical protein
MGEYGGTSALTPTPGITGIGSSYEIDDKAVSHPADQYSSMASHMGNSPSHRPSVVEELKRSERNMSVASSGHNGPGSVPRIDSSSSGASMASAQCGDAGAGPDARTPTPLRLREASQSFNASASYFTYPRPGGDDQADYLLQPPPQPSQMPPPARAVSTSQLFHLTQPFQPSFNQNQYMSVPPGLTQYPSQQSTQGLLQQDRQNSRGSTSSEVSSISPAMLRFKMPHSGSPLSMDSDEQLQPISASTSPRSHLPLDLPVPSAIGMTKRESTSSMHTDMEDEGDDADDADGVEKNGMMWGMPTEAYRSLSARERKRVRNRISARTFRARRKGLLRT